MQDTNVTNNQTEVTENSAQGTNVANNLSELKGKARETLT